MQKNIKRPSIWIVIVNWNGIEDTIECLNSFKKVDYPNYKIVLIDNGSLNGQADKIRKQFPKVKLIKNTTNTGFVIANNQGIELAVRAKAQYIMLLNNDTVVSKHFLDPLINTMEKSPEVGAVSPKILYYKSKNIWSMGGKVLLLGGISTMIGKNKPGSLYKKAVYPDFLTGCAFLVRSEIIDKVGLLDPIYFAYYEDVDWSYRIVKSGYNLMTVPNSIIWHKKSASAGIKGKNTLSNNQIYLHLRNGTLFARKNFSTTNRYVFIIGMCVTKFIYTIVYSKTKSGLLYYFKGLVAGITSETK